MDFDVNRSVAHFVNSHVIVITWLDFVKMVVKVDGKETIVSKVCLFYGILHSYGDVLAHVSVLAYQV